MTTSTKAKELNPLADKTNEQLIDLLQKISQVCYWQTMECHPRASDTISDLNMIRGELLFRLQNTTKVHKTPQTIDIENEDVNTTKAQESWIREFDEKFTYDGMTGTVALKTDNAFLIKAFISAQRQQAAEEATRVQVPIAEAYLINKVRKILCSEGVLSMSIEKALDEIAPELTDEIRDKIKNG